MEVKSESEVAQSCPTLRDPHGLQPTSLLHPWDFPGKSTGVGYAQLIDKFLFQPWHNACGILVPWPWLNLAPSSKSAESEPLDHQEIL